MDILFLIGRILFGGFFISSGINHFTKWEEMSAFAKAKGVPLASTAVPMTGVLLLLGGSSLLLGAYPIWGIFLLAVFLIPTSLMMHAFWTVQDPMMKMNDMVNFMKNLALLGALLMFLAIPRPWPLSLALG